MSWNYMQIELVPADRLALPLIGPGGLDRQQAHAEIQSLLDRTAALAPPLAAVADKWRAGAKDDTVYGGTFIWTIYEHPECEDPRRAAVAWIEDLARRMRGSGLNVQTPRLAD